MKVKFIKNLIAASGLLACIVLVSLGGGYLFKYSFKDVMFVVSIIVLIVGLSLSVKGNPMSLNLSSGGVDSQYDANMTLEATKIERELTKTHDISVCIDNIGLILSGVLGFIISYTL
ncbi:MAG: hypothetical protein RSA01_02060 [Clostridium sp.]|uniref:hypothetical protein n=1 Tax=Clostridium sp. TaxID=1506 RepID=UPI002FC659FE